MSVGAVGEPEGVAEHGSAETRSSLPHELRALGRSLGGPAGPGGATGPAGAEPAGPGDLGSALSAETMVERVLAQILTEHVPAPVAEQEGPGERLRAARRWTGRRWRSLTAALCGLLTVLALTPPVRAAVLDWFDFDGVKVRYEPSAVPSPGAQVPGCGRSLSPAQAGRRAGFTPLVPDALGTPDAVTAVAEPGGRFLLTLCWRGQDGSTTRLDEYPARLDLGFVKTVREPPEWVPLGPGPTAGDVPDYALWFQRPHLLTFWLVDADGHRVTRTRRTAGPTLLWTRATPEGAMMLRLEGITDKGRAVAVARNSRGWSALSGNR
ncbi:hypothetical protein [Streptomyces sp. NRRL S-340]|uniref:hypothetical protein n=1 Tax=Streptomyces sp. NRRL S-340 TaxID=1463901 RepID=UPI003B63F38D